MSPCLRQLILLTQSMGRAPCCDKANVKRGPWSPEEDKQLKEFIERHGTGGNWIALPQKAGLRRCGKSCRLRWLNYLRPNIKLGDFNEDEDRIICGLVAAIGSRWSIIAAHLPGRTDNDIKNYWNTKLKKKLLGLTTKHMKKPQQQQLLQPLLLPSTLSSVAAPAVTDLEGIPIPPCPMSSFTSLGHQNGGLVRFEEFQGDGFDKVVVVVLSLVLMASSELFIVQRFTEHVETVERMRGVHVVARTLSVTGEGLGVANEREIKARLVRAQKASRRGLDATSDDED
ncbi:hypothetical protein ZIOFF_064704 [Zingiber officinale]|uniref:Uncharacterized protein n=1 Tax=Zingiber officinale TaxID=94328 RepID=A0A8J5K6S4_ZINOF|nr:hypothetical protein ZIOFF_064704 [Zingiber officinale]